MSPLPVSGSPVSEAPLPTPRSQVPSDAVDSQASPKNQAQPDSSKFPKCGITLKLWTAATVALHSADAAAYEAVKIKIDYPRKDPETPGNPLAGLYNYLPLAQALLALPSADNPLRVDDLKEFTKKVLAEQLESQNIYPASTSCRLKEKWTERLTAHEEVKIQFNPDQSALTLRLQGEVNDVGINHDHFGEGQKLSTGGNTSETLGWVVKVKISGLDEYSPSQRQALVTTLTEKFQTQNGQASAFSRHAEAALRKSLQEGKPTENVNSLLNDYLSPQLRDLGLPAGFEADFKIHRPQVLRDVQAEVFKEAKVDLPAPPPDPGVVIIRQRVEAGLPTAAQPLH